MMNRFSRLSSTLSSSPSSSLPTVFTSLLHNHTLSRLSPLHTLTKTSLVYTPSRFKQTKGNNISWEVPERAIFGPPRPQGEKEVQSLRKVRTYLPPMEKDELLPPLPGGLNPNVPFENPPHPKLKPYSPPIPYPRPETTSKWANSVGHGFRKTAHSKAVVRPGTGTFLVNTRPVADYFKVVEDRDLAVQPIVAVAGIYRWDTYVTVKGGGPHAQAIATQMAIARALEGQDQGLKSALQNAQFFRRDIRKVERKKPGQLKARRKFQWVKR
eukprot:TRINITY_DN2726_c0_g2_i1.p1 TRINITY_DN2726_c0_g2~~TRINITY_DN2726_c0_g2_i1.p1  ORF type:complete len:269 (+),score=58.84 TRINITY_DN2726_c0_g2_i1:108-914(+)